MKIVIRRARPAEAEELSAIALAAKRHWGYPEEWMSMWRDELVITPEYVMRHEVYCADRGPEILGLYALEAKPGLWEFEHFWVRPPSMGKGIGRQLFGHAIDLVRGLGGRRVRIVSDPNAQGFYAKMGARRAGDIPSRIEGRSLPVFEVRMLDN